MVVVALVVVVAPLQFLLLEVLGLLEVKVVLQELQELLLLELLEVKAVLAQWPWAAVAARQLWPSQLRLQELHPREAAAATVALVQLRH
jgi:hypothetical protein